MICLSKAGFIRMMSVRVRNAGPFVSPLLLSEYKTMCNFRVVSELKMEFCENCLKSDGADGKKRDGSYVEREISVNLQDKCKFGII